MDFFINHLYFQKLKQNIIQNYYLKKYIYSEKV